MNNYLKLVDDMCTIEIFSEMDEKYSKKFTLNEKIKLIHDLENCVSQTPMIKIDLKNNNTLFIKQEGANGFSVKMRTVLGLLVGGILDDKIKKGTIIAESSSGNTAIAEGYLIEKVFSKYDITYMAVIDNRILAADPKSKGSKIKKLATMLKTFDITEKDPSAVYSRLNFVEKLKYEDGYFVPNQYDNKNAIFGSYHYLAKEIDSQLQELSTDWNHIDYIVNAISTGAHSIGLGVFAKQNNKNIKLIATEQQGSAILSDAFKIKDTIPVPYLVGGAGHRFPTKNVIQSLKYENFWDCCAKVSDYEAFNCCFKYNEKYNLFLGPSTGMNLAVIEKLSQTVSGKVFLTVSADNIKDYPILDSAEKVEQKYSVFYEKYGDEYMNYLRKPVSFGKVYTLAQAREINHFYSKKILEF